MGSKINVVVLCYEYQAMKSFWLSPDIIGSQIYRSRTPSYSLRVVFGDFKKVAQLHSKMTSLHPLQTGTHCLRPKAQKG